MVSENEGTSSEAPVDDRRGDIAAAVEQVSGGDNAAPDKATPAIKPSEPGQAQNAPAAQGAGQKPGQGPAAAPKPDPGKGFAAKPSAPTSQVKPPQAWKPEARELWPQVPPRVQQEIAQWNSAVGKALHESQAALDFQAKFDRMTAPYQMLLRQESPDPLVPFESYLKTLTELRTGSPHTKASSFAQLVNTFGIDVNLLDAALAAVMHGRQMPRAPQQQQEFRDPRVDQIMQALEEREQSSTSELQRSVSTELGQFAEKSEFFGDVREEMADLLEMATKRGQVMSIEQAYERACKMNQEVSNILSQRELEAKAATARQAAQRARGASLSVHGAPTVPDGAPPTDGSRRSDIEAAIAQLSGR